MQRDELVSLIKRIQRSEGTEEEADRDIDVLYRRVADPQAINYIFQQELDAEEIADRIINYKPLQL